MCTGKQRTDGITKERANGMKKKLVKVWNAFLVISVYVAIIGIVFWTCCVDSDSNIPMIMLAINEAWLVLIFVANDPNRIERKEKKKHGNDNYDDGIIEF